MNALRYYKYILYVSHLLENIVLLWGIFLLKNSLFIFIFTFVIDAKPLILFQLVLKNSFFFSFFHSFIRFERNGIYHCLYMIAGHVILDM